MPNNRNQSRLGPPLPELKRAGKVMGPLEFENTAPFLATPAKKWSVLEFELADMVVAATSKTSVHHSSCHAWL